VEKSLLETIMDQREETRVLTVGSSEQRRKTALLRAQEKLQLTADASAASSSSVSSSLSSLSLSPSAPVSLSTCQYSLCPQKPNDGAKEEDGKAEAAAVVPVKLLQCGGCRLVSYCCTECQRADWPQHKLACKHAQQLIKAAMTTAGTEQTPAASTAAVASG
jgi:hypothetical protein